jgi:toxin FitB
MIVLDTNVISELMRPAPDADVTAWLDAQDPLDLATTTITIAEIQRGIVRLPTGKRRKSLQQRFTNFVEDAFPDRLLGFDRDAAYACGEVSAAREPAASAAAFVPVAEPGSVGKAMVAVCRRQEAAMAGR